MLIRGGVTKKIGKGGGAIGISKYFVKAHLGLDLIINQSVKAFKFFKEVLTLLAIPG